MGRVDHQLVGLAALGRQRGEYPVEYAEPAPPDEAIIDRLVRTIVLGRVAPAQAVPDDEDDPADHPSVIDPGNAVRQWEMRRDPAHLCFRQPNQIAHDNAPSAQPLNQSFVTDASTLMGPEPSHKRPVTNAIEHRIANENKCPASVIRIANLLDMTFF